MPSHVVAVSSSDGHLSPPPGVCADQYVLIRLSNVEIGALLELLETNIGTVNQVPNIEELHDESLELCVLKSYRSTVQDMVSTTFPKIDVELDYDPYKPIVNDLKFYSFETAKNLCQYRFF